MASDHFRASIWSSTAIIDGVLIKLRKDLIRVVKPGGYLFLTGILQERDNLFFEKNGEHYDYFSTFFMEVFYNQKNNSVKESIGIFLNELFDKSKTFTKSDLDLYTEIYKLLDKNILY